MVVVCDTAGATYLTGMVWHLKSGSSSSSGSVPPPVTVYIAGGNQSESGRVSE